MQSFAIKEKYLTKKNKEDFLKIDYIFKKLPERKFSGKNGEIISITCHHLAHALEKFFSDFKAIDGWFFNKGNPHSRLEEIIKKTEKSTDRNIQGHTIIDPYPRGGIRPQMYFSHKGLPRKYIYLPFKNEERKEVGDGFLVNPEFKKQVELIQLDIEKILKKIG